MDKKALQLAARFALPPNSLGFCGKDTAPERFKQCFIHGEYTGVEEEIEKFIVLHPYIKTLGEITGRSKFSYKVIEAYWLGNDLLKQIRPKHYLTLLRNFSEQDVPGWLIEELRNNPPARFIPHHLFQVLFVGVGRASHAVPFNLESINNCMIRWGKVVEKNEQALKLELHSLKRGINKYVLTKLTASFSYNSEFLPGLKTGDVVAVHWQQPVKILTNKEVKNLAYWTTEILEALEAVPLSEAQ